MKVAFASPRGVERDGIGAYSRDLSLNLSNLCRLEFFDLDHATRSTAHFRRMADAINRCDLLHVEHNYCYFNELIPFREAFRDFLRRVTIPRLVVYHEIVDRIGPIQMPGVSGFPAEKAKQALLYGAKVIARPVVNQWWLPRYNREIFSIPEKVVVHSDFHAEIVERFAPGVRPVVMPLPVPGYRKHPNVDESPAQIPFGGDDIVLTIFGFINRRKDYLGVLQALARMPQKYKLLIAGGPHDERDLRSSATPLGQVLEFIQANGLEDRVHITGFFPESHLPAILEATRVIIAPFSEEHCSASINIGLAYSKPVVAYATRLTREMNRNGAGFLEVEGAEWIPPLLRAAEMDPALFEIALGKGHEYRAKYGFPMAAEKFVVLYKRMAVTRPAS